MSNATENETNREVGIISASDLKQTMIDEGYELTDDSVDEMIREFDVDGEDKINFEEFVKMS